MKVRVVNDDREGPTIGRKYNEWEIKGVPLRIEIGQKELEENTFRLVRRFDGDK
jgi:prolyl-tRNA synthetase